MKVLLSAVLCTGLVAVSASASAYANGVCEINTARDVLNCAMERNPNMIVAQGSASAASIKKDISGRWVNPVLDISSGYNNELDYRRKYTEVSIMQEIDGYAKRKAKKGKASAEYNAATAGLESQKEIVTVEILTMLNRTRQIEKEKVILDEITGVFANVIKRYKNRPALSPEDQISGDMISMAMNNYVVERNKLSAEEKTYLANLNAMLDKPMPMDKQLFFYPPQYWPTLNVESAIGNSTDIAREQAVVDMAHANYYEDRADAISSFSIGAYAKTRPDEFRKSDEFGLKISMPIPIFTGRKGARAGQIGIDAAEQAFEIKKRELTNNMNVLKEQYLVGVSQLSGFNIDTIEKNHSKTKRLFQSGRVSGTVMIEANRQLWDSVQIYHNYEIETLQALWRVYALERKLLTNLDEVCYEK